MTSQNSKFLYKSFFDNTLDGLAYCKMLFDKEENPFDFIYIEVNKNFEKLTGLSEVVGKKVTEHIPGINTSNPELFNIYKRVSSTGKPERFETYIEPLSKWFLVSIYCPKKKFFVVVFQDITDRKLIEKNLEDTKIAAQNVLEDLSIEKSKAEVARAKEEAILFSIGDGLLATDEKGNITFINKTAEKLLGQSSEEVMGKVFNEVIYIEDEKGRPIPSEKRPMSMALSTGVITSTTTAGPTYYYGRKDGTKFPIAITVTPVVLLDKVIGTIEVFRDITREKDIDKAKTEFVSLASHQLRSPLTTISWYAEMILNGDVGKVIPEQKKYLEEIYQGNERMVELVNTLLDVSRIELGTFVFEPKPTDLTALAQNVLDEQKPKIEKKKLRIKENFSKNIPIFLIDPNHIRMIFQNLLNNAIEYTPPGGSIEFTIFFDAEKHILIKVSDTGYGIPKNQRDHIFTKLFRADNVRDKDTKGTGLGLYIIKSIIENLGGKIWFESEENKGATFYVSLVLNEVEESAQGTQELASVGKEDTK